MLDYDDKLTIQTMLDRLIVFKLLGTLEGSTPIPDESYFYQELRWDYMHYSDALDNLVTFFEYANIGEIQLDPEFLLEELQIEENSYEGCLFIIYLEDLQRLEAVNAPKEKIDKYVMEIQKAMEFHNNVDWLETNSDVIEIVGATSVMESFYWHQTVEKLITIIGEIRKDCIAYENNCND